MKVKCTFSTLLFLLAATWLFSQTPRLVVPTGHSDAISAAAISPDEKLVLTGSDDQSVILWGINGKEIRTLKGFSGRVLAVAFAYSGDEKLIVAGDNNGAIKCWDLAGNEKKTIYRSPGFRHAANWLSELWFSPDGKKACMKARNFDVCVDILSDTDIDAFEKQAAPTPPAGLAPDEQVVFGKNFLLTYSGSAATLRDLNGKKIRVFTGYAIPVNFVAFSPLNGGSSILTKSTNGMACLWDIENGTVQPNFTGKVGAASGLEFSPDGKEVIVATENAAQLLNLQGEVLRTFGGSSPVAFSPDGKAVITGVEKGIKLWDRGSGKELRFIQTEGSEFEGRPGDAFFVPGAGSGNLIATGSSEVKIWNWENSTTPLKTLPLQLEENDDPFLGGLLGGGGPVVFAPDGKTVLKPTGEAAVTRWDVDSGAKVDEFIGHHERVNTLCTAPASGGGMLILTGSDDNTAKLWDPANNVVKQHEMMQRAIGDPIGDDLIGGEIQTYRGHANDVLVVAFSPAGADGPKYVLTGSSDNTAKIWDRATGTEIATLINLGENDWVVATPSGLFDASPGAMNLMYYAIGAEVVELDQLKERYYEPGLLAKLLGYSKDAPRDVSTLGQVPLYPLIDGRVSENQLNIQLTARSGGMGKLSFFINGKEVAEDLNPDRKTTLAVDLDLYDKYYLPGTNTLALRAYNSAGWLKSQAFELTYDPPVGSRGSGSSSSSSSGSLGNAKPHLYAIVIGTSDYSGKALDLRFPDLDAAAMANALQAAGSRLFEDRVHLKLLTTAGKTAAEISSKKTIAAAFEDYAKQAKPTDILVVYFSGHGLTYGSAEKSQFYYLTKDIASADLKDDAIRKNYTVSSEDLTRWLTNIPAKKQVMILDACNSGKVVESFSSIGARELNSSQIRALDRMKDRTGMFILTGAAGDKVSFEASQYGQGLLTYSLLQGMSGLALTSDKRVDVMTLFQYACDQVPELAKSIRQVQKPVLAAPANGGSFDIGIVDAGVKIPLAQVKPLFIRNNFQNEDTFDDNIGLTNALAEYFQLITGRGAQADLIYVDVSEHESAYSIKGRYTVNGDDVEVRGRLFQGKTSKGEFSVKGKKSAVQALVEALVEKVSDML